MNREQVLMISRDAQANAIMGEVRRGGFPMICVRPKDLSGIVSTRVTADIVLVDIQPDDPSSAVDVQLARHFFPGLPILVIADLASTDFLERAVDLGADDFIVRSSDGEVCCLRIRAALQRWRRAQKRTFQRERAAQQQMSDAVLRELGNRLSSVVFYCALLNMKANMPSDASACVRHVAEQAAELRDALKKLTRLSKLHPAESQNSEDEHTSSLPQGNVGSEEGASEGDGNA